MTVFKKLRGNIGESSFTLFETVVALGIMATMMVELSALQGNTIYFSEYTQNATQAAWLAKRVMSQVEYNWIRRDFSDIKEVEVKPTPFDDVPGFSYSLIIKNWKLPILDLITQGGAPGDEEEKDGPKEEKSPEGDMIAQGLKQFIGDELLKVAHVKVSWAEGAKSNEVTLTYLMTNQRKVDESIGGINVDYDKLVGGSGGAVPSPSPTPGP